MNFETALPYVSYVVDDAGCGRELGTDPHALVRVGGGKCHNPPYQYASRLVGWQCGFEPLFVAVHSYLDVIIDDEEAEEMATEYLDELGWFGDEERSADYVI